MSRYYTDCRETPNEVGCTLLIAGEKDEVLEAAAQHAFSVHSEKDTAEFRRELEESLKPVPTTEGTTEQADAEHAAMLM